MERPTFALVKVADGLDDTTFWSGTTEYKLQTGGTPPACAFVVYKYPAIQTLEVFILDSFLRHILTFTNPYVLSFLELLKQYDFLKNRLHVLDDPESSCLSPKNAAVLKLLIDGFLLNRSIFRVKPLLNIDMAFQSYLIDMQHRSIVDGLRAINTAFKRRRQIGAKSPFEIDQDLSDEKGPVLLSLNEPLHLIQGDHDVLRAQREGSVVHGVWRAQRGDGVVRSTPPPLEGYGDVRAFQSIYSQIPHWSEGWQSPTDVEDCLVWELSSACDVSKAESDFLYHFLAEWPSLRGMLPYLSSLRDAPCLMNCVLIFEDWGEHRLAVNHLSLSPAFESIRRVTRCEKKDFIVDRLHEAFKAEDRIFREKARRIDPFKQSSTFRRAAYVNTNPYSFVHQWYYKAWDKGIATIRRVLEGKRPNTLEQICRLLLVAYAMGSQDPSNPEFQASFVNDLDRWRTIVPEHSLLGFDVIAKTVWGKTFENLEASASLEYGSDETLLHLQQLLSGLISRFPLVNLSENDGQEDHQTHEYEQSSRCAIDSSYAAVQQELAETKDPRAYPDIRKLPICWEPAPPIIILLMAGAIFGFIFSFLLIFESFALPSFANEMDGRRYPHFANFEERNLHTLMLYMGLSSLSTWQRDNGGHGKNGPESHVSLDSEDVTSPGLKLTVPEISISVQADEPALVAQSTVLSATAGQSSVDQLNCPRCGKQFSNTGNRNRHMRFDCNRKARFPCRNPGCRMVATRKAYRDKHESSRCPLRRNAGDEFSLLSTDFEVGM